MGPSKTAFIVHTLSICKKAPFFEKATSPSSTWTEAKEKTVTLSDTEPEVFEAYLHWVYTAEVELKSITTNTKTQNPPSHYSVAKLWLFADMMLDHNLCNRIADTAVEKQKSGDAVAAPSILSYIWDRTPASSKLRTLYVDILSSCRGAPLKLEEGAAKLPHELIFELALRHLRDESRHKITKNISKSDVCSRYHIHGEGAECEL